MLAAAHRDAALKRACCRHRHEGGKRLHDRDHDGVADVCPKLEIKVSADLRPKIVAKCPNGALHPFRVGTEMAHLSSCEIPGVGYRSEAVSKNTPFCGVPSPAVRRQFEVVPRIAVALDESRDGLAVVERNLRERPPETERGVGCPPSPTARCRDLEQRRADRDRTRGLPAKAAKN